MRIYISGPMTGLPDYNRAAFNAAASALRGQGYDVENPAENPPPPCNCLYGRQDHSPICVLHNEERMWEYYMELAYKQVDKSDAIGLLPGWEISKGAGLEASRAVKANKKTYLIHPTTFILSEVNLTEPF